MKVKEFDTERGIYKFHLEELNTEFHSHPAHEIIFARRGNFSLTTVEKSWSNLKFAFISRNVVHRVEAIDCQSVLMMIEQSSAWVQSILALHSLKLQGGIYVTGSGSKGVKLYDAMVNTVSLTGSGWDTDPRVSKCLSLLNEHNLDNSIMIDRVKANTHISESRISHLFSKEVGLSLKKYLVWARLKRTIKSVLDNEETLFAAGVRCGFHDQAHLSKAFKAMLGISPSQVYNSRTVQE